MTDALEDHEGTVSVEGRTIINLCLADDLDGLAGQGEELANLVEHLDNASTAYDMEIRVEKTKLMTNNTSGINTEIKVNGQKLETVTGFKYLGSVITDEGSKLLFTRSGQNHLARHSERGKMTMQAEEEVGRQHQGMDRPEVRQVPEGSGEQGKMEKTGCEIICGAPTTLAV